MADTDTYSYTLQSCDNLSYPDIPNLCTNVSPSPFSGLIVYINQVYNNLVTGVVEGVDQGKTYLMVSNGLNATVCNGAVPTLGSTVLDTCADPNADKLFKLVNCANEKDTRNVLLATNYALGTILRFTGECSCWNVFQVISNYDENPTVDTVYLDCTSCLVDVTSELCDYEERTLGTAVKLSFPKPEPINRGFKECCYSNIVLADLSDSQDYRNDFTSVFYKRQTQSDTVVYQLIGATTGLTVLVDGTHGFLYPFGEVEQPNLSYFRVDWLKILGTLGEDVYTIRMVQTIAGSPNNVDSLVTYELKQFSQSLADSTVRIDWTMDGKLEKIDTDFKNSGYTNSIRVSGYFGDRKANWEQDTLIYSTKKGKAYFVDQITMSNSFDYLFAAYNVPECVVRPLYSEGLFGNEIFISDYNLNNHDYRYELFPVIFEDDNGTEYQVRGRGANVSLQFSDRQKNNRKTNC